MGFVDIVALAAIEVVGDFNLRWYAQTDALHFLWKGAAAYVGVLYFLVRSLRGDNVLYVNGLWDGMSGLIESIAAYVLLGDRLKSNQQYVGLIMTLAGVVLMKMG